VLFICETCFLRLKDEYRPMILRSELEVEFLKENLLRKHRECHLFISVILTLHKLFIVGRVVNLVENAKYLMN